MSHQRVAIVHERFTELAGSEKVVEQLHAIWPEASVHAAVIDPAALPAGLVHADLRASQLQRLYRGGGYAHLLPLMPRAMARLDVTDADLVITCHHAFANRVRIAPNSVAVSYTLTPARWMWDRAMLDNESGGSIGRMALSTFAATQRRSDVAAAGRMRGIIAISRHVAGRVRSWWRRSADVVPPPVDTNFYSPAPSIRREDFFLLAGRLVPYKRPEVAVAAARRLGTRLVVAGDGRSRPTVEALAGPGVELLGRVDDVTLRDLYRRCSALVYPGEEDFGIVPVEAQACGAPVLALGRGGVLDSVVDGVTGTLYHPDGDEVDALARVLKEFTPEVMDTAVIRRHAESFSPETFRARFVKTVERLLD